MARAARDFWLDPLGLCQPWSGASWRTHRRRRHRRHADGRGGNGTRATRTPCVARMASLALRLKTGGAGHKYGSPDIKVGLSPGRSDQELCDLGRKRLIHGFFWDLPEQCFLASVDGRLRRPRSGWGACSAAAKSRRKVLNLWLLLDDRWAGDTAQVVPVR